MRLNAIFESSGENETNPPRGTGNCCGNSASRPTVKQRADEIVERSHARAEDDERLGVFPCHHNVVRSHAIRNVVAAQCGRSRQALRDAALGWHDVNFSVAVVLRSKSDLSAVRRKP